jgi:FkbM family methyltransferase
MAFYSQAGEDQALLDHYLNSIPNEEKIYIEAGAMDGIRYSNTKALEESFGWTGVLVEPHPANFAALEHNRPGNFLVKALISNSNEPLEYSFFDTPNLAAVSGVRDTLSPGLRKRWYESEDQKWLVAAREKHLKTILLHPVSLSQVLRSSGFDRFGFFSLDVEGHEYEVLSSYDWSLPIRYILVENNGDDRVKELLGLNGYSLCANIAHNHLYCHE